MKVWVSKYAERGTAPFAVDVRPPVPPNLWIVVDARVLKLGRDAHETREAAVADAEKRRTARIAFLRRQIAKLEALSFEEPADG